MRVLIVEPSQDLAGVISKSFNGSGVVADIAHTAQMGISRADENKPDMVVLEVLISEHNGLEFIHEFKSYNDWFDIPIVIYSDLSAEELGRAVNWREDMNIIKHFYKPTTTLRELNRYVRGVLNEN
ncbi:MAG: response regulator [Candidatus Saccharimonadales bacterium]